MTIYQTPQVKHQSYKHQTDPGHTKYSLTQVLNTLIRIPTCLFSINGTHIEVSRILPPQQKIGVQET